MLYSNGFDLWAENYDQSVDRSDDENLYPFAGYKMVLDTIYNTIMNSSGSKVLDIGFGTGALCSALYKHSYSVYGQDFSEKMIDIAKRRIPGAHLYQGDFSRGLVEALQREKYDFIVSTYALHHLTDKKKRLFISGLKKQLNEGGLILIGDIAFENKAMLDSCRIAAGSEWDNEEYYFIIDEWKSYYPDLIFKPQSYCAGVIIIK